MKYVYPKEKPKGIKIETTIVCSCGKKFTNITERTLFVFSNHILKQMFYDLRAWLHVKAWQHKIAEKYDML